MPTDPRVQDITDFAVALTAYCESQHVPDATAACALTNVIATILATNARSTPHLAEGILRIQQLLERNALLYYLEHNKDRPDAPK